MAIKPWQKKIWEFLKPRAWYIVVLIISTSYVIYYRKSIYDFKEINARNLVFLLCIALLVLPLFSEMEFLGIKVKRELQKATEDVKDSMQELRIQVTQMQTQMQMTSNMATNINLGEYPLASEKQLKEFLKSIAEMTRTQSAENRTEPAVAGDGCGKNDDQQPPSAEVPVHKIGNNIDDKSVFLFKIRYDIETTLRNLCEKTGCTSRMNIFQMLKHLTRIELLNANISCMIQEVMKIANRGVHGEIISDEYINFVKNAHPAIMAELQKSSEQLVYTVCPRCNYSGYAAYANVCPRCKARYDDY